VERSRALQTTNWKPIVFLKNIIRMKRLAVLPRGFFSVMVTSLHDRKNLCQEFIASARTSEAALILSILCWSVRGSLEAYRLRCW